MLAPIAFRTTVRGTEYLEADEPETEVWHACQRANTAVDGVEYLLVLGDSSRTSVALLIGPTEF